MKSLLRIITIVLLLLACIPYFLISQNEEIDCSKSFNLFVYESLLNLDTNNLDMSSNKVKLIFELSVSECGKLDSVNIKKSNLSNFGINDSNLISSLIGKKFICIREVYYEGDLLPDKVIVIYNTK